MPHLCLSAFNQAAALKHASLGNGMPVKEVLLVGGLREGTDLSRLSRNDECYVSDIVTLLPRFGGHLAPDARLQLCTLPSMDFLDTQQRADLVVFCKVFFHPNFSSSSQMIDRSLYRQSPRCHEAAAWHAALTRTQAHFAVNVHKNEVELPTPFLDRRPYEMRGSIGFGAMTYDVLAL